jgi:hypothetical protein
MQKTQLALFPLQLFLLPGETTQLHIFEERYQQLLLDCEEINIAFGIPYTENGKLTGFGSTVKLKRILNKYQNGTADIEIESVGIFKVEKFFIRMGEKLYPGGDVALLDQSNFALVSNSLFSLFNAYMAETNTVISPETFSADFNLMDMAKLMGLDDAKKLAFLRLDNDKKQEQFLKEEIGIRMLLLKQSSSIVDNVFLN